MKEKDKAKEIVLAMQKNIHGEAGMVGGYSEQAKKCALIAVDLMLNEYKELNERPEKLNHFVKRPEYWQTVRTEIEKL